MHIFIDESGNFALPLNKRANISAVGALVVRDTAIKELNKLYSRLRHNLPKENGEVKGRLLNEKQVASVVSVLKKLGCIFEIVAIDSSTHTRNEIIAHQRKQAEKLTENITDKLHPNIIRQANEYRATLENLPPQLYLQSVAMAELIYNTINYSNVYYSFRWPKELAAYHWIVDAKGDNGITNWEQWWSHTIPMFLESKCLREPFIEVEGGDFSAHERFRSELSTSKSERYGIPKDGDYFNARMLLQEDFRFESGANLGLEVVDILVNAIRRSMIGNFRREGWLPIRSLMIHRNYHYIELVTLSTRSQHESFPPYYKMLEDFITGGKDLLRPTDYKNI